MPTFNYAHSFPDLWICDFIYLLVPEVLVSGEIDLERISGLKRAKIHIGTNQQTHLNCQRISVLSLPEGKHLFYQ